MESICALIFTLILMFPLVIQLQMLIANPKKLCSVFHYYATQEEPTEPTTPLLQCYPDESTETAKRSDSRLLLSSLRTVSSSPAMASVSITNAGKSLESQLPEARHSSTFVKTDQVLPVVDITWTYSSYRYMTFEACLRDYYGPRYPPGEVVLNSMQLNLLDSRTDPGPGMAGLFDFVKESETALNGPAVSRKLEIEYLNPLDHFVTRRLDAPCTEERCTETQCERTEDCLTTRDADDRDGEPIRDAINEREKNDGIDRRSTRKIELPCRCNMPRRPRGH